MGVYAKNKGNESTWGALDFDAHKHGQDELAKNRAIRAFTLMLEYRDRYLILSASVEVIRFHSGEWAASGRRMDTPTQRHL